MSFKTMLPRWLALGLLIACAVPPAFAGDAADAAAGAPLDLRQAIELALAHDPALRIGALDIEGAQGRALQAGLSPNPEAGLEVEDVLGTGNYHGLHRAQSTLQISQLFELGGKLDRRVEAANATRDLARADLDATRLDVMAHTTQAFVAVLGAQRRVSIAGEQRDRAAALVPALKRRVDAGASPAVEVTRGQVAVDLARIEVQRAQAALDADRRNLAAQWGSTTPDFGLAAGDLDAAVAPPPFEALSAGLDDNPRLARWTSLRSAREAEVRVQRSLATPDLTVGVGLRRYSETDDTGLVVNLSIPLPVRNRNQGNIIDALKELQKTGEERSVARNALYQELSDAYGDLAGAWSAIESLRAGVLPAARDALRLVQAGYAQGRFGILDLFDAQNTLSEAQGRYGDALVTYHAAVARIEGLTARPLIPRGAAKPVQ